MKRCVFDQFWTANLFWERSIGKFEKKFMFDFSSFMAYADVGGNEEDPLQYSVNSPKIKRTVACHSDRGRSSKLSSTFCQSAEIDPHYG